MTVSSLCKMFVGGLLLATVAVPATAENHDMPTKQPVEPAISLITLGTAGGPPPHAGRAQPSNLLVVNGSHYLIDAGEGARYQLQQVKMRPLALDAIFITHLHWDHVLGLDYLMATDWMQGRSKTLPIYGPPGLDSFLSRQAAALEIGEDIFSSQSAPRPKISGLFPPREIADCERTEIFRDEHVAVTAICNSHFAEVRSPAHSYGEDRALSYRFDTAGGAVTFTGDTGPSAELEELAKGSDILVSEIVDPPSMARALDRIDPGRDHSLLMTHMRKQHLAADEVGKLAKRAGVKTVVLTHYVIGWDFDPAAFEAQVREHFSGDVIVARDLDRISLNNDGSASIVSDSAP